MPGDVSFARRHRSKEEGKAGVPPPWGPPSEATGTPREPCPRHSPGTKSGRNSTRRSKGGERKHTVTLNLWGIVLG